MCAASSSGEGSAFLSFKKGDLIKLDIEDGQDVMQSGWCTGICERSGEKGDFPAECVYVLPAIARPAPEVLVSESLNCVSGSLWINYTSLLPGYTSAVLVC